MTALVLSLVTALGVYILNEVDGIERLAIPLMAMIVVQAVVAIGQAAVQGSLGLAVLGEQVLQFADGGVSIVAAADGTYWLRAYGLTDHPNVLGGILAFALIILALARGLSVRRSSVRWVVFALGAVVLFLTFSRAGWIAYGVGVAVAVAMLAVMRDRPAVRRLLLATCCRAPGLRPIDRRVRAIHRRTDQRGRTDRRGDAIRRGARRARRGCDSDLPRPAGPRGRAWHPSGGDGRTRASVSIGSRPRTSSSSTSPPRRGSSARPAISCCSSLRGSRWSALGHAGRRRSSPLRACWLRSRPSGSSTTTPGRPRPD